MKKNTKKNILVLNRNHGCFCNINFLQFYLFFLLIFFNFSNFKSNILASTNNKFDNITIKGQIKISSGELKNLEGLNVVLLKYVLNKDGEVTPVGPQQRVKTKKKGNFIFFNVISDFQAGFQLGTRLEENLYSSKIFFMKEGEASIEKDILIPRISYSVEKLEISKISIVFESGLGKVLVTEVLVFSNSSQVRIDTKKKPLEYKLPEGIINFRMLSRNSKDFIKHHIEENILKIEHIFQPGDNQIIYQYSLPARFGNLGINREFDHSLDIVGIFTPIDLLEIRSDMIAFVGKQKINQTTFLTWKSKISDSNRLKLKISNVPQTYFQYFFVSITLLFLFFCTVLLFFRKRLIKGNI